jgi:hypothetical protein
MMTDMVVMLKKVLEVLKKSRIHNDVIRMSYYSISADVAYRT